jgi:XTP/dITP diphosphohydrolase
MKLLLGTTNPNKVREIHVALAGLTTIDLLTLADLPPIVEPEETAATYWENARIKALAYARASGLTAVAEDSGLEIAALDGAPGVNSARFLGPGVPYAVRFDEIYRRLKTNLYHLRDARFMTALAVAAPDGCILFETETAIEGTIADQPAGTNGFGYDPIFSYPPFGKTTAELTTDEKNSVSHRARAFRDLARWLRSPL